MESIYWHQGQWVTIQNRKKKVSFSIRVHQVMWYTPCTDDNLLLSLRDPMAKKGHWCWKTSMWCLFTLIELNLNLDSDRGFGSSRLEATNQGKRYICGHTKRMSEVFLVSICVMENTPTFYSYSFRPNSHRTRMHNASKWDLLLSMGVFTLVPSNIKGKMFQFACASRRA